MTKKGKKFICECGYNEVLGREKFVGVMSMDFDGVMNLYEGYKGEEELYDPRPGLEEFILDCKQVGYKTFFVLTARDAKKVKAWLDEYNLTKYFKEVTNVKKPADVYIDDRAIQFKGDFNQTIHDIINFKVHWEK